MALSTLLLDTNVLMDDPKCFRKFHDTKFIIPLAVIEELDNLKTCSKEKGAKAREVLRELEKYRLQQNSTSKNIALENNCKLYFLPDSLSNNDMVDNKLIQIAKQQKATLVTNDLNLRLKAGFDNIKVEEYVVEETKKEKYLGFIELMVDGTEINKIYESGTLIIEDILKFNNIERELYVNEYVILKNQIDKKQTVLCKYIGNKQIKTIDNKVSACNIKPRNLEQTFAIDAILDPTIDIVTIEGNAGTGKAQPLDADILTPNGYVKMGDIKVGDYVMSDDGKPTKVLGVYPQGEKEIFKVSFSDGASTECCEDHLWNTKTSMERDKHKTFSTKTLKEIKTCLIFNKKKNHSIPITKPVQFENRNVPIDPYLLGVLLGDGCIKNQISFTTTDEEILQKCNMILSVYGYTTSTIKDKSRKNISYYIVDNTGKIDKKFDREYIATNVESGEVLKFTTTEELNKLNFSYNALSRKRNKVYKGYMWTFGEKIVSPLKHELIKFDLYGKYSYEKYIPEIYKFSDINIRLSLLQGLMDTDGTVDKRTGLSYFSTTSERLKNDVVFLVESLGGTAKVKSRITNYTYKNVKKSGRLSYNILVNLPNEYCPFTLKRKIDIYKYRTKYFPIRYITNVESVGIKPAQCILVESESHLYLTNNFIVTHNTLISLATMIEQYINKKFDTIYITKPVQPVGGKRNDLGALPGDLHEKLMYWFMSFQDAIETIKIADAKSGASKLFKKKSKDKNGEDTDELSFIEYLPFTFMRGRSLSFAIICADESQNTTKDEMKTLITRMGNNSKIILLADIDQIDATDVNIKNNGFTHVCERFKGQKNYAHIVLSKCERSKLAAQAAKLL